DNLVAYVLIAIAFGLILHKKKRIHAPVKLFTIITLNWGWKDILIQLIEGTLLNDTCLLLLYNIKASWSVSASAVAYGVEFMQNRNSTTVDIDDDMRQYSVLGRFGTFSLFIQLTAMKCTVMQMAKNMENNKHMLYALAEDLLVRLANLEQIKFCCDR
ncbi:hypothetical protein ACJX0J_042443, partial [Zea mays]